MFLRRTEAEGSGRRRDRSPVESSFTLYPTAGTSDDYAFSRHLVDSSKAKVIAYTIEWGSEHNPTPFHPPYNEMQHIIQEVMSGLLEFCLRVMQVEVAGTV